jgi:hypothetical protein
MWDARALRVFAAPRNRAQIKGVASQLKSNLANGGDPLCAIDLPQEITPAGTRGAKMPPALYMALLLGEVEMARIMIEEAKVQIRENVNKIWILDSGEPVSLLAAAIVGQNSIDERNYGCVTDFTKQLQAMEFALENGVDPNGATTSPLFARTQMQNEGIAPRPRTGIEELGRRASGPIEKSTTNYLRHLHLLACCIGKDFWKPDQAVKVGRLLLNDGGDINAADGAGDSPLTASIDHHAHVMALLDFEHASNKQTGALHEVVESVRVMLELGADPNLPNAEPSPMFRPLDPISGNLDFKLSVRIANLLLQHGADLTPVPIRFLAAGHVQEYDYLRRAVQTGNVALILFAIDKAQISPDVRIAGGYFMTLLSAAVSLGDVDIVRLLLGRGANPNAVGGGNPAYSAFDVAHICLRDCEMGLFPDAREDEGTAEHLKIRRRYGEFPPKPTKDKMLEIIKMMKSTVEKLKPRYRDEFGQKEQGSQMC